MEDSQSNSRFERGFQRVPSVENYDLFNQICIKSSLLQRKQSRVMISNQSSDQLTLTYEGNQFWQEQSHILMSRYLQEVCETLDDIMKLIDHLHSLNEEEVYSLFNHLKKQLRNLKIQLETVQELLTNCKDGETLKLIQLKALIKQDRKIQAKKSAHVNVVMVNIVREFLVFSYFPQLLQTAKHALENFYQERELLLKDVKIYSTQILMINLLFCTAVDQDRDSLFSLEKNHQDWKDLYDHITFKELGDTEQIQESFDNFAKTILMGHVLVQQSQEFENQLLRKLIFGVKSVYYQIFDVKKDAFTSMSELKMKTALEVMNLVDQPVVKKLMSVGYEKVAVNLKIYVDPVVKPITIEWLQKQIQDGTINTTTPIQLQLVNEDLHMEQSLREHITQKNPQKLRIRIISKQRIDDSLRFYQWLKPSVYYDTIIIHLHGGGFISGSSSSHQSYTRMWVNELDIPIFSIDYSLAPKYPYPNALDDVYQGYQWILLYLHKYFNINPSKIIVTGDSAGGNLTAALTALLIKLGQRVPNGILLSYPALDLRFQFTPSYIYSLNDKIISHTILGICTTAYSSNPKCQLSVDPFMSPLMLSDEILSKFPPTRLICGSKDPLYDNSLQFVHRLSKLKRDVNMIVYENMSHGFLQFNTIKGMHEIQTCIYDAVKLLKQLIEI